MELTDQKIPYDALSMMLNALPVSVYLISKDYRIQASNTNGLKRFKGAKKTTQTTCYQELYQRESPCPFCPTTTKGFEANKVIEKDIQEWISPGEERNVHIRFVHVYSSNIMLIETIEDTTAQKKEQEGVLLQENLAALGVMVSGVAHELNNPLTGIGLTLQNLMSNIHTFESNEILEKLKILKKDMMKASRIVSDILSFTNSGRLRLSHSNLSKIAQKATDTTKRLYPVLSRNITWDIDKINLLFDIDVEKIERLFINLFRNSIHAFDYGSGYIKVSFEQGDKFVRIFVEDNAGGIKKDKLTKIFHPFYSESKGKHASGLGLSICHSIIKDHNGNIHVRSFQNKTRFYISLPIQQVNNFDYSK